MKIRRTVLIPLIIVVVIIVAASVGGYLLYTNYNYYSTDDAQVTGNVVNIDAMATGLFLAVNLVPTWQGKSMTTPS